MFLHPRIREALFKHQREITSKLSNVRGLFKLDHIAIIILNSDDEVTVFSSTPAVEFNLIEKGLWQLDAGFSPKNHADGSLFWWDEAYSDEHREMIRQIKEFNYGFTLGFCLTRKRNNEQIIYSCATRSAEKNLKEYYESHKKELLAIGDYAYGLLQDVYAGYCISANGSTHKKKSHLKLIVSNK